MLQTLQKNKKINKIQDDADPTRENPHKPHVFRSCSTYMGDQVERQNLISSDSSERHVETATYCFIL